MAYGRLNFPLLKIKTPRRRPQKVHQKEHERISIKILQIKQRQNLNIILQNVAQNVQLLRAIQQQWSFVAQKRYFDVLEKVLKRFIT